MNSYNMGVDFSMPDFIGQAQAAAPFIVLAIVVAVIFLVIENWPETPKRRPPL